MADDKSIQETWLPAIGNALAILCLDKYAANNPDKTDTLLKKAQFLMGLGVPDKNAATAVGTTPDSIAALGRQQRAKKGDRRGKRK